MTTKTYLPPGITRPPSTPAEALVAARCVIEEEGRWAKETWFTHHDTEHPEYRDDPFCNGWETCAAGALQLVTVGLTNEPARRCDLPGCDACNSGEWLMHGLRNYNPDNYEPAERLCVEALKYLADEAETRTGDPDRWDIVPRFNDAPNSTRDDVIAAFRDAEAKARAAEVAPVPA